MRLIVGDQHHRRAGCSVQVEMEIGHQGRGVAVQIARGLVGSWARRLVGEMEPG